MPRGSWAFIKGKPKEDWRRKPGRDGVGVGRGAILGFHGSKRGLGPTLLPGPPASLTEAGRHGRYNHGHLIWCSTANMSVRCYGLV